MASALRTNRRVGTAAAIGEGWRWRWPAAAAPLGFTADDNHQGEHRHHQARHQDLGWSTRAGLHHHHPLRPGQERRKDVTTTVRVEFGGLWVLNGEIKNSASVARTYQIVVDYVTDPGDTVLDTQILNTKSVKPGASLAWVTKSEPGLTHVSCVIRQVQAPAP